MKNVLNANAVICETVVMLERTHYYITLRYQLPRARTEVPLTGR